MNDTQNTQEVPIDRYTEFTVTVGFTNEQIGKLMADEPTITLHGLFSEGVSALQQLAQANMVEEGQLLDTSGIVALLRESYEAAGVEPIRLAVRYRESDEWTENGRPNLYVGDGKAFLQNPPPYGNSDGNGAWEEQPTMLAAGTSL